MVYLGTLFPYHFAINGNTLQERILIKKYIKLTNDSKLNLNIEKLELVEKPNNLPKFKTFKQAVDFVNNLEKDNFIDDAEEAIKTKKGNCLAKARILYFVSKQLNEKVTFRYNNSHVTTCYKGTII